MPTRVTLFALLAALAPAIIAQDSSDYGSSNYEDYGSDDYGSSGSDSFSSGSDSFGSAATTTYTGDMNAYSEYPELVDLLQAVAPQVTSISPAQADALESKISQFDMTYTIPASASSLLNYDPDDILSSAGVPQSMINQIDALLVQATDAPALAMLASVLSGVPSSSAIMAYQSAVSEYENSALGWATTMIEAELSTTLTGGAVPTGAMASETGDGSFTANGPSTFTTRTGSGAPTATVTKSGSSSTGTASGTVSGTASASSAVSSGLAAATAAPQVLLSAVAAAAGIVGIVVL